MSQTQESSFLPNFALIIGWSLIFTSLLIRRGIPPNLAVRGSLPSLGTITSKHFLGPCEVCTVEAYFLAIFALDDLYGTVNKLNKV